MTTTAKSPKFVSLSRKSARGSDAIIFQCEPELVVQLPIGMLIWLAKWVPDVEGMAALALKNCAALRSTDAAMIEPPAVGLGAWKAANVPAEARVLIVGTGAAGGHRRRHLCGAPSRSGRRVRTATGLQANGDLRMCRSSDDRDGALQRASGAGGRAGAAGEFHGDVGGIEAPVHDVSADLRNRRFPIRAAHAGRWAGDGDGQPRRNAGDVRGAGQAEQPLQGIDHTVTAVTAIRVRLLKLWRDSPRLRRYARDRTRVHD